ncbi:uncharacterized protein Gasu_45960 [Galdieria sulphuraria]|uniref:Uncharacterized protein n=1 Tax=Galdieria sulphuraria TaxID=130081 RepID=M2WVD1_GALSU|nr:uncharacterized protein Gasu_45960 [Galdieria sulphuraria]EME27935.1 hypothetical protein Gasu_45960 [Galdieria sulphuraria]|eukprot:XP_005704455.1 hypothetical protein Gasu_45960 [Galdieria sulphuraria]
MNAVWLSSNCCVTSNCFSTHVLRWGLVESTALLGTLAGTIFVGWVRRVVLSRPNSRGLLVKRRPLNRRCPRCSGFGIYRCPLCRGGGLVDYEKKYLHSDPCPMCFCNRFVTCILCKGSGVRPKVALQSDSSQYRLLPKFSQLLQVWKGYRVLQPSSSFLFFKQVENSGSPLGMNWTTFPMAVATATLFLRFLRRLRSKTSFS